MILKIRRLNVSHQKSCFIIAGSDLAPLATKMGRKCKASHTYNSRHQTTLLKGRGSFIFEFEDITTNEQLSIGNSLITLINLIN